MKLKKSFAIAQAAMLVLTLVVMSFPVSVKAEPNDDNENHHTAVQVCHKPNTAHTQVLTVDDNAVNGHLGHGDYLIDEQHPASGCVPVVPSCTLSANPNPITAGNSTTLTLDLTNASSATVDHSVGALSDNGTASVSPTVTTTYTATITGGEADDEDEGDDDNSAITCSTTVTVNEAPAQGPTNSCVAPTAVGGTGAVTIGTAPGSEHSVQAVLDTNYGSGVVNAVSGQTDTQQWNGSNNTVHFSVSFLDKNAGDNHVFGYVLNGGAFVPVFKDGSVGNTPAGDFTAVPVQSAGPFTLTLSSVSNVVFAMYDVNHDKFYYTKKTANPDSADHAVTYNPANNEYVIGFEDLALSGDHDYNDLIVKVNVTGCENPNQITVVATKIVCDNESDLPNAMASSHLTDANTAANFLAEHKSCHLQKDWQFEWGNQSATDQGRDFVGPAVSGYTTSGLTAADGTVSMNIPLAGLTEVHLREVLKDGYIPFTYDSAHQSDANNVSAEFSCSNDGLHYDNFDFIRRPVAGNTYYCVAWNVSKTPACNADATATLLSGDQGVGELITAALGHGAAKLVASPNGAWFAPGFGDGLWIWKDTATSDADAQNPTSQTFERGFTITGTPLDATLTIAADNTYDVKVNGHQECSNLSEFNYGATVNCTIPAADIVTGANTLDITVTNLPIENSTGASNPAGLSYKLVTHDNQCKVPENPTNGTIVIVKDTTGGDGSFDFDIAGEQGYDADVTTVNGQGTTTVSVAPGNYNLTETGVSGWNLNSVSCQYDKQDVGNQIPNGEAITIAAGHTVTCIFHNTKTTDSTPTSTNGTTGSGGGKKHSNGGGEVLGASTCSPLLTDYLKLGWKNKVDQVSKLQQFLNDHLGLSLPTTGFFGQSTFNAVKQFQKQYGNDVLHPWVGLPGSGISGDNTPTGFVYQTTRWKINNIFCPGSEAFPTVLN